MFYILVAIWFVVCFVKCFLNPEQRNAFLKLIIATLLMGVIVFWLGSPKGAGLILGFGLIPPVLRLATMRASNHSGYSERNQP